MITLAILALILILGFAVLVAWQAVNPKHPSYTVEDGSIKNFNITNDHLNAASSFLIKVLNPNRRISVYHDLIEVTVSYDSQTLAFNTLTFYQPSRNVTELNATLEWSDVALPSSLSRDMRVEKHDTNVLKLPVRLKAKTRYKVGGIKFRRPPMKILCSPVLVHFSSSNNFEGVYCDLDY